MNTDNDLAVWLLYAQSNYLPTLDLSNKLNWKYFALAGSNLNIIDIADLMELYYDKIPFVDLTYNINLEKLLLLGQIFII